MQSQGAGGPVLVFLCVLGGMLALVSWTAGRATPPDSPDVSSARPIPAPQEAPSFRLVDRTLRSGVDFSHLQGGATLAAVNDVMGAGLCLADFDADGDIDIYLVNGSGFSHYYGRRWWWTGESRNALYLNRGDATFFEAAETAGVADAGWGMGCAVGDYDNDGYPDLYVTNYGANVLYHNSGDGSFEDVSRASDTGDVRWGTSSAWADVDEDGDLDLFVLNYIAFDRTMNPYEAASALRGPGSQLLRPELFDSQPNLLYRNLGGGRFAEVAGELGLSQLSGRSLGTVFFDYDLDGDLDVYVANDYSRNSLMRNDGPDGFVDVGGSLGVDWRGSSHGVAVGDYDNDGDLDLVATGPQKDRNLLYENLAGETRRPGASQGRFRDRGGDVGLGVEQGVGRNGWSPILLDIDNDGSLDLFVANGHRVVDFDNPHVTVPQYDQILVGRSGVGFHDVSERVWRGPRPLSSSRGAAAADLDGDGDLDIAVVNNNGRLNLLETQIEGESHWIVLRLEGTRSNRDAIGSRVELRAEGRRLLRTVDAGSGYLSQSDVRLHFGLGDSDAADSVRVIWPSGVIQDFGSLEANQFYLLVEGDDSIQLDPRVSITKSARALEHESARTQISADEASRAPRPEDGPTPMALRLTAAAGLGRVGSAAAVDALATALESHDAELRRRAVRSLAEIELPQALPPLLLLYNQETDTGVREEILRAFAFHSDATVISHLAIELSDASVEIRRAAAHSLAVLFEREKSIMRSSMLEKRAAAGSLIRALTDIDADVRIEALSALGHSESYRAVVPVFESLDDPDSRVRQAAAAAAGNLRDRRATPRLRELLDDASESVAVRTEAAYALRRLEGSAHVPGRSPGDKDEDRDQEERISQPPTTPDLELLLSLVEHEDSVLLLDLDLAPYLELSFSTGTGRVRSLALRVAAHRPGLMPPRWFADAMQDPIPEVQLEAARLSPRVRSADLRDALHTLARNREGAPREAAIRALAGQELTRAIVADLNDWTEPQSSFAVRAAAFRTLITRPDDLALIRLIAALESEASAEGRLHLTHALAASSDPRAATALVAILERESDDNVRQGASEALANFLGLGEVFQRLLEIAVDPREPLPMRRGALDALTQGAIRIGMTGPLFPTLARVASRRDDPLRGPAIEALGSIADVRAAHLLGVATRSSEEALLIRQLAARSLVLLAPKKAEAVLVELLRSDRPEQAGRLR